MLKPSSLRAHLEKAVPELARDPERLVLLARAGQLCSTGTGSLSFEYRYTLQVVVLDYAGHADALTVPLLAWLAVHQPELLDHPEKREKAIRFEVEYLNAHTVDLSLEVDLTERVLVKPRPDQPAAGPPQDGLAPHGGQRAHEVSERGGLRGGAYDIRHVGEPAHPAWPQQREEWRLYLHDQLLAEWTQDPRPVL